ncbi:hypothetical protein BHE74_00056373 [Ensete ventricosum]|nr:hypothetical protein BHE74_00056373 [Ensete ventricosum]RZS10028.1 hypothetical protein BHM03_00041162 [Ensete ventricosum]
MRTAWYRYHTGTEMNSVHRYGPGVEMLSHDDDDEKWLAEGIAGIQHNAFYMQRALVGTQSYYNALIAKPNLHHSPNVVLLLV